MPIDSSHEIVKTPISTYCCVKCWACACHQYNALTQPCLKNAMLLLIKSKETKRV